MDYRVEKYDSKNDRWLDYGRMPIEDAKAVVRGYKKDALGAEIFGDDGVSGMYTRKGTLSFFTIEAC